MKMWENVQDNKYLENQMFHLFFHNFSDERSILNTLDTGEEGTYINVWYQFRFPLISIWIRNY